MAKLLQSCLTLRDPMDYSLPGSSVPGIFQARVLEWVAIAFSRHILLLLLLRRFSHVRLCATPWTTAYQAPPSLGFSRQEHWGGLPFPSPMHESEKWSEVAQSCLTLSDPMDCSPPGSSIHGIFRSRVLKWGATAFTSRHVLVLNKYLWMAEIFNIPH